MPCLVALRWLSLLGGFEQAANLVDSRASADSSKHEAVIAMKSQRIVQYLASDAVRGHAQVNAFNKINFVLDKLIGSNWLNGSELYFLCLFALDYPVYVFNLIIHSNKDRTRQKPFSAKQALTWFWFFMMALFIKSLKFIKLELRK